MTLDPIPASPFGAADSSDGGVDFQQIVKVLLKKAWLIVLLGLVGAFAGLYFLKVKPQFYFAQAVLQVDSVEPRVVNFENGNGEGAQDTQDMVDTYVATLKSRPFLAEVVKSNKLASNPDFFPIEGDTRLTEEDAVNQLMRYEDIVTPPASRFINVGIKHKDPRMAQMLANAICDELIKQGMQQRAKTSSLAVEFLSNQAEKLKGNLTVSESNQEIYIENNASLSVNPSQDTTLSGMKSEEANLNEARAVATRLEADDQEAAKYAGQPSKLLNIPSVVENPLIIACKQQISEIEGRIVTLGIRYTELHPKMIQARSELAEANAALAANLDRIPTVIHSAYESALIKQRKFEAAETAREEQLKDLNKKSIGYNVLHGTVEINRALYQSVLKQLGETEVAKNIDVTPLHVFEAALLPGAPVSPNALKILAIAIGGGMAVGIGIALGLNALDTSLKSVDQAEHVTGLPVAGAIPVARSRRLARTGMILQNDPGSSVSEAFRSLRTYLFFKGRQKRPKTVLFTSAVPGEGKTFCSVNCAVSMAQQGLRTIIVDADLRAPAVARVLFPKDESPGLTAVLEGRTELKKAILPLGIESLFLLPGGRIAANPAELLATPELGNLIEELEEQFDCVIIDSAPILPVCDTLLLVPYSQAVCVVIRAGKTPRKAVLRTSKLLAEAGASVSGLLLNMLSPKSDPDHYVYRQKYGAPENYGEPVAGRLQLPPRRETAATSTSQNGAHHD